jgi:hypothetical protein
MAVERPQTSRARRARTLRPAAMLVFVARSALFSQPAWAQQDPSVAPEPTTSSDEALIQRAIDLRRAGAHAEAAAILRSAYAMRPSPRACGQLALAEQAIGRWAHAERRLREALAARGDPWVERNRAVLEAALATAERRLGTVEIVGGDEGAELWVDGERAGALPSDRSLRVVVGTVRIEHRPPEGPIVARVIELAPGGRERVYFAPRAAETAVASESPAHTPVDRGAARASSATSAPRIQRAALPPRARRDVHPLTWVGATTATATGVGLLVAWAAGESIARAYEGDCVSGATVDRVRCAARQNDDQRRLDVIGTITDVGWALLAAGSVAAGVGVALTFSQPGAQIRGRF